MQRRNFLRTSSVGALALSAGLNARPVSWLQHLVANSNDKILVLIRLAGGNDGLNTVIGLDHYDNLAKARPGLVIPTNKVLKLNNTIALHPAMTGMRALYDEGKLGIIQGVGYPDQNRSHFRSTDIWSTASAADESKSSGWLGDYLDEEIAADDYRYPADFPNQDYPYPLAVTMGNVVSNTCQGNTSNLSQAVRNPRNYLFIAPGGNTPVPDNNYGREVRFVRELIGQSNSYGEVVQTAANAGSNQVAYPETGLGDQLRKIAWMISGGLGTKVYVVTHGGFDTHADQIMTGPTQGRHAILLKQLSDAVLAFQRDMEAAGFGERIMGMTFSEFGRQIRSNQSGGTDHGTAAPLFYFGGCIEGGIMGENPVIGADIQKGAGVEMQFDFRKVYGSVVADWFGGARSQEQRLSRVIAGACGTQPPTSNDNVFGQTGREPAGWSVGQAVPNPLRRRGHVSVLAPTSERVTVSLVDLHGREVRRHREQLLAGQSVRLSLRPVGLPAGTYVWRLTTKGGYTFSRKVVKV